MSPSDEYNFRFPPLGTSPAARATRQPSPAQARPATPIPTRRDLTSPTNMSSPVLPTNNGPKALPLPLPDPDYSTRWPDTYIQSDTPINPPKQPKENVWIWSRIAPDQIDHNDTTPRAVPHLAPPARYRLSPINQRALEEWTEQGVIISPPYDTDQSQAYINPNHRAHVIQTIRDATTDRQALSDAQHVEFQKKLKARRQKLLYSPKDWAVAPKPSSILAEHEAVYGLIPHSDGYRPRVSGKYYAMDDDSFPPSVRAALQARYTSSYRGIDAFSAHPVRPWFPDPRSASESRRASSGRETSPESNNTSNSPPRGTGHSSTPHTTPSPPRHGDTDKDASPLRRPVRPRPIDYGVEFPLTELELHAPYLMLGPEHPLYYREHWESTNPDHRARIAWELDCVVREQNGLPALPRPDTVFTKDPVPRRDLTASMDKVRELMASGGERKDWQGATMNASRALHLNAGMTDITEYWPDAKTDEGDWICIACYEPNLGNELECVKCALPTELAQPMAPNKLVPRLGGSGDWKCIRCKKTNWRSRSYCIQCMPYCNLPNKFDRHSHRIKGPDPRWGPRFHRAQRDIAPYGQNASSGPAHRNGYFGGIQPIQPDLPYEYPANNYVVNGQPERSMVNGLQQETEINQSANANVAKRRDPHDPQVHPYLHYNAPPIPNPWISDSNLHTGSSRWSRGLNIPVPIIPRDEKAWIASILGVKV